MKCKLLALYIVVVVALFVVYFFQPLAPKCSSYTSCRESGHVLVADAESRACAEVFCTPGECCTDGVFAFVFMDLEKMSELIGEFLF